MNPPVVTVLFLSTGNAVRGIMAEALLRHTGSGRFVAYSAGYRPAAQIDPVALSLLKAESVPLDGLFAKGWQHYFEAPQAILIDVIVTLSEEARLHCPAWPGHPIRVHWPVDDPAASPNADERIWKMRKCLGVMQSRVSALTKQRGARSSCELLLQLRGIAAVV